MASRGVHTYERDEVAELLRDALDVLDQAQVSDGHRFAVVFPLVFQLLAQKTIVNPTSLLGMPPSGLNG